MSLTSSLLISVTFIKIQTIFSRIFWFQVCLRLRKSQWGLSLKQQRVKRAQIFTKNIQCKYYRVIGNRTLGKVPVSISTLAFRVFIEHKSIRHAMNANWLSIFRLTLRLYFRKFIEYSICHKLILFLTHKLFSLNPTTKSSADVLHQVHKLSRLTLTLKRLIITWRKLEQIPIDSEHQTTPINLVLLVTVLVHSWIRSCFNRGSGTSDQTFVLSLVPFLIRLR